MLVCVNAAGESLWPLIVTSDKLTREVFRNGLEGNVHLRVHVGGSASLDPSIFERYLCDVFIPEMERCRSTHARYDSPVVLFIDNCSGHLSAETMQLLSEHKVKRLHFHSIHCECFRCLISSSLLSLKRQKVTGEKSRPSGND
jgi:hypothetical protein